MVDFTVPIQDGEGNFLGIAGVDIALADLEVWISSLRPFQEQGFVTLFSDTGSIMGSGNPGLIRVNIGEIEGAPELLVEGVLGEQDFSLEQYDVFMEDRYLLVGSHLRLEGTNKSLCVLVNIPSGSIFSESRRLQIVSVLITFIILGITVLITILVACSISRLLVQSISNVADGSGNMAEATQQNAASSEEIASMSEELASQVEQIWDSFKYFKLSNND